MPDSANGGKVPVIYLVEPTAQNLQIVTSDLSRGLYSECRCDSMQWIALTAMCRSCLHKFPLQHSQTASRRLRRANGRIGNS
jgi:hypothetical protein